MAALDWRFLDIWDVGTKPINRDYVEALHNTTISEFLESIWRESPVTEGQEALVEQDAADEAHRNTEEIIKEIEAYGIDPRSLHDKSVVDCDDPILVYELAELLGIALKFRGRDGVEHMVDPDPQERERLIRDGVIEPIDQYYENREPDLISKSINGHNITWRKDDYDDYEMLVNGLKVNSSYGIRDRGDLGYQGNHAAPGTSGRYSNDQLFDTLEDAKVHQENRWRVPRERSIKQLADVMQSSPGMSRLYPEQIKHGSQWLFPDGRIIGSAYGATHEEIARDAYPELDLGESIDLLIGHGAIPMQTWGNKVMLSTYQPPTASQYHAIRELHQYKPNHTILHAPMVPVAERHSGMNHGDVTDPDDWDDVDSNATAIRSYWQNHHE